MQTIVQSVSTKLECAVSNIISLRLYLCERTKTVQFPQSVKDAQVHLSLLRRGDACIDGQRIPIDCIGTILRDARCVCRVHCAAQPVFVLHGCTDSDFGRSVYLQVPATSTYRTSLLYKFVGII